MENTLWDALIKNGGIVGGLTVVYFIIKLFMNGRFKKNGNISNTVEYTDKVKVAMGKVEQVHEWLKPDSKGIQEWKHPNLTEAIGKLTGAINEATKQNAKTSMEHTVAHRKIVDTLKILVKER